MEHGQKELNAYEKLDKDVRKFERIFSFTVPVLAIIVSLAFVSIIIVWQKANPFEAFGALFSGAFGNPYSLGSSLNVAAPLIFSGVGIALAARGGIINLGAEGQIIFGGIFATLAATQISGIPAVVHVPLCLLVGFLGGALWAFVPAFFNARFGTNVMITTMLMNDIAMGICATLVKGPMMEKGGFAYQSEKVAESAKLPLLFTSLGSRLHLGFVVAVICAVIAYFVLFKSPVGHDIRVLGENPVVARHSGMSVLYTKILVLVIAGGLAGMGGACEILGAQYRLRSNFLMNYGYEALAVAMLANKNPLAVILSGILFGGLKTGRSSMSRAVDLPASFSMVLSGVIIFFVAISPILMELPRKLAMRDMQKKKEKEGKKNE